MLSKNNRQQSELKHTNKRQRFGLRKLTVGVASVLLGTTFFMGAQTVVANADAPVAQAGQQTEVSANAGSSNAGNQVVLKSANQGSAAAASSATNSSAAGTTSASAQSSQQTAPKTDEGGSSKASSPVTSTSDSQVDKQSVISESNRANQQTLNVANLSKNSVSTKSLMESKVKEQKATFSGTFWTDGLKTSYNSGDKATFYYRISSFGTSTVKNPKFYIRIPKGFIASNVSLSTTGKYTTQDPSIFKGATLLGTDQEGSQVWQVNTSVAPDWNGKELYLKAPATAQKTSVVNNQYGLWNQLVFADSDDMNPNMNAAYGGGTEEIKLTNGTILIGARDADGYNAGQGSYTYSIIPGQEPIPAADYTISNVKGNIVDSKDSSESGSEQVDFTLDLNHPVQNQGYIDVNLGLTKANGSINQYDSELAPTQDIKYKNVVVGKIYNMGNFYRIAFDSDKTNQFINTAAPSNPFVINFSLNWASGQQKSSLTSRQGNPNGTDYKPIIYQYTDDQSQDGKHFNYVAKNDIYIGNSTYSSNLKVPALYVYKNNWIKANNNAQVWSRPATVRTWDSNGRVEINSFPTNAASIKPVTANGDEIDVTVSVGKNKDFVYNWASADQAAKDVQNNLAWHHKTTLSIPLKSNGQLYFESNEQKSDQEKSKVTVTIENKDDANNYTRIYHIKFADPTVQYDSDASLSFLTVGIPNYTIPDNVHSFDEDWKTFKAQGNLGFGGDNAITGNSQVLNDVINTPGIYYKQEKVDSSGKRTQLGFAARYNWMF